jgi:hypothetical protein
MNFKYLIESEEKLDQCITNIVDHRIVSFDYNNIVNHCSIVYKSINNKDVFFIKYSIDDIDTRKYVGYLMHRYIVLNYDVDEYNIILVFYGEAGQYNDTIYEYPNTLITYIDFNERSSNKYSFYKMHYDTIGIENYNSIIDYMDTFL